MFANSDDGGLKLLVLGWAKGNEQDCLEYIQELYNQKIKDMQALVKRAKFDSTWEKLMDAISGALEAELREWFENSPEL
jgi:hypothetical protein